MDVRSDDQARRDELFDALHAGTIDPEEAERLARVEGLGPLRDEPGALDFNPEAETWWTLPMVMAWIVWRTMDRVREQYDPYRQAAPFWTYREYATSHDAQMSGTVSSGYFLEYHGTASAMDLSLKEAFGLITQEEYDIAEMTVRQAREELWRSASEEAVRGVAVLVSTQEVVRVPDFEWSYLELQQNHGRDELCFAHHGGARYRHVKFRKAEAQKKWQAKNASVRAKRDAKERCKQWLIEQIGRHREVPTMTKKQAGTMAKSKYGVSRDAFRDCWKAAIVATNARAWARGGRPSGKQAEKTRRTE